MQRSHFKTEWHLYNLKRKVCNLDPIDLEGFHQIQATNQAKDSDETTTIFDDSSYIDLGVANNTNSESDLTTLDDDEWDKIENNELLDEEYTDMEVERMLAQMIQSDTCLFCDHKSPDLKCNLGHMDSIHGFFLPEEQYLIDLEGMMDYLGFKVGAGSTCLWCNKQFTTLHGVRLHMLSKDHCKIFYDQERAAEFREYYDYSEQEQIPMKPVNELVITATHQRRPQEKSSPTSRQSARRMSGASRDQLVKANGGPSYIQGGSHRGLKKFNATRAKILLRTDLANNKTIRARVRSQNPI